MSVILTDPPWQRWQCPIIPELKTLNLPNLQPLKPLFNQKCGSDSKSV